MLTAKDSEIDKINELTLGADDYITKPFRPLEMVARVKAQLRRYKKYNPAHAEDTPKDVLSHSRLIMNIRTHECLLNEQPLILTLTEFSILRILLENKIGYLSLLEEAPDMPAEQKEKYLHIAIDLYYKLVQFSDELSPVLSANGNSVLLKADENLTIKADPDQLAKVFNNVLKNGAAYGFPNTEIIISAEEKDNSVIISFQNEGQTIPQEKLSMIFEKFYRLDDARTNSTGGTGLGLAIAREIITLHGGSMTAPSENDTVTFIITLPADHLPNGGTL